jgi:tRNA-(ms[2]io[6]A)-hydroxylase
VLGLKADTDPAWAEEAARDLDRVLVDHAHCEMKAASNALSLAARHPGNTVVVRALANLAREEIDHFQRVLELLSARGLSLGAPPVDEYAAALRRDAAAQARDPELGALVDRLLVGALIEARSCERFKLLGAAIERRGDHELAAFYAELFAAEARHHRDLVDLAVVAADGVPREVVLERLARLAEREAAIVRALARREAPGERATIHG